MHAAPRAPLAAAPAPRRPCPHSPARAGECEQCRSGRPGLRRSPSGAAPAIAPPIVREVLGAPGQPLDGAVRARMEPRFRHSFADVRVHADGRAAESARAVGARAYAVGRDVVFGAGRYAPGSAEGERLIAHELAHVVQQRGAPPSLQPRLEIGAADDAAERQADAAAAAVAGGGLAPAAWAPAGGAVLRRIPHDAGTGGGGPPRDIPREPAGEARDAGADAGPRAGAERERAMGLEELIELILRFLREVVRVLEQGSRMPEPLPRDTGPAPQSCLFTFDTQADLDARKAHWAGVIAGMPAADAIGWMIGRFTPPTAAATEATTQKDCLLDAIRASAATAGSPLRLPAGNLTHSGRRDFDQQEWIWRRKFEFWTRAELTARERARGRTGFTARTARFDRVSQHAVDTCGSLAGSAGGRWDPDNPAHRVCWNVPAAPGTTAPPIPAGKTHLSDDERQQEILQASSAPGISRHHAGTDFDLFDADMNPREWETGGDFADEYSWMMRNASRYGFIQSFTAWSTFMSTGYMEERWHWSYYPVAQALLEFGRANQAALGTRLMSEWGSSPQFSYIRANWRSYVFNVSERGVF
jgi:hypothetical protein